MKTGDGQGPQSPDAGGSGVKLAGGCWNLSNLPEGHGGDVGVVS